MKAEFNLRAQGDISILDMKGEIDDYSSSALKTQFNNLIKEGPLKIALNFKDVDFMDTTCLGVLCSTLGKIEQKKGQIKLFNLKPNIRKVFDITRLSQIFKIYDTEDEALGDFSGS